MSHCNAGETCHSCTRLQGAPVPMVTDSVPSHSDDAARTDEVYRFFSFCFEISVEIPSVLLSDRNTNKCGSKRAPELWRQLVPASSLWGKNLSWNHKKVRRRGPCSDLSGKNILIHEKWSHMMTILLRQRHRKRPQMRSETRSNSSGYLCRTSGLQSEFGVWRCLLNLPNPPPAPRRGRAQHPYHHVGDQSRRCGNNPQRGSFIMTHKSVAPVHGDGAHH